MARAARQGMKPAETPADIWRNIGTLLAARRKALGWSASDVQRNGGPTYKTVLSVERGRVSRLDLLDRHALALDLDLCDVLRDALGIPAQFSGDACYVARSWAVAPPAGRTALKALARHLLTHRSPER